MNKVVVNALAIYGALKLTEKVIRKIVIAHKDDICKWAAKKTSDYVGEKIDEFAERTKGRVTFEYRPPEKKEEVKVEEESKDIFGGFATKGGAELAFASFVTRMDLEELCATVADWKEMIGETPTYSDTKIGWTFEDIRKATFTNDGNSWRVNLPDPIKLY